MTLYSFPLIVSWQLGLVEREINEVLQGHVTSEQNHVKMQKKTSKVIDSSDGHNIVEQREITEGDVCPICQEDLLTKKQLVTYCKYVVFFFSENLLSLLMHFILLCILKMHHHYCGFFPL